MATDPTKQLNIKCNHRKIYKRGSKEPLTLAQVEQYLCYQCHEVLFHAMQLSCCGNRLCSDCLSHPLRSVLSFVSIATLYCGCFYCVISSALCNNPCCMNSFSVSVCLLLSEVWFWISKHPVAMCILPHSFS